MKCLICLFLLLSNSFAFGMEKPIRMPDKTLEQLLQEKGLQHFIDKTNVIQNLADQEKYALGVAAAIEDACAQYRGLLNKNISDETRKMTNNMIVDAARSMTYKTLLKDHPEALQELKEARVL